MNTLQKILVAALAYIVLQVGQVHALECYMCNSQIHGDCETPGMHHLKNCSSIKEGPKFVACRKIDNWVDFKVLGQEPTKRVIRQCAADVDEERLCYYRAGFGGRANVCDCFGDRCNTASTTTFSMLTLATVLIALLLKNNS